MQTTTVDGYKFLAVRHVGQRLLNLSKTQFLPTPTSIWRPRWTRPYWNLTKISGFKKVQSFGYHKALFSNFSTISACTGQRDKQTV